MTTNVKGYKFRIYPNKQQRDLLARSFGCTRFVWNQCLGRHNDMYEAWKANPNLPKPSTNHKDFNQILNELKAEYEWLYEVSCVPLQQVTRHLTSAFTNFFRNLNQDKNYYPQFKKKTNRQSIELTRSAFSLKDGKFYMVKSPNPIKVKWSRTLPSYPSSCTISQDPSGHYYVSFNCETLPHLTNGTETTGIDLGLTDFLVTDKGTKIPSPKYLRKSSNKLKRLQRQHSRKTRGSKNRNKARLRVAKQHRKVSNQRNDFLHKLSRCLVNENQVIGIESLKVMNMIKNRKLSRAISDAGWSIFINMLVYKASESHRCTIVHLHPHFPSTQLCSTCNTLPKEKIKLSTRVWTCTTCSTEHDRDINAAKNILQKALKEYDIHGGKWYSGGIIAKLID